jgi:RimJ/RimL family protein N-acetyltransferase
MLSDLQPVVLRGNQVCLEPLEDHHAEELFAVGRDEGLWRYLPGVRFTSQEDARRFVEHALVNSAFGNELQFVIRLFSTGTVIGTTRYQDIQPRHGSVEIGWTFVHPSQWFRGAGTESIFLLAQQAIEEMGAQRVWLKTDGRNLQTQKLIEKCGVHREGVLRRHMCVREGFLRDSVIYSVLPEEWPEVKQRIEQLLARRWASSQRSVDKNLTHTTHVKGTSGSS